MSYTPLPENINDWPEQWRFLFNERAGMIQHHGCLPKAVAERDAEKQTRELHKERRGK
tara:strand:+ start:597 stop:770 length:174 start_codon:yes stop_codon:yes gene_type:complete